MPSSPSPAPVSDPPGSSNTPRNGTNTTNPKTAAKAISGTNAPAKISPLKNVATNLQANPQTKTQTNTNATPRVNANVKAHSNPHINPHGNPHVHPHANVNSAHGMARTGAAANIRPGAKPVTKPGIRSGSTGNLSSPALALSSLHKPGLVSSASPAAGPGPVPATSKYAKIQPAIAIKPKPLAVAGSSSPAAAGQVKSTFNPRYSPGSSSSPSSLALPPSARPTEEATANINTSKNWVLPPRPRPGRKPDERKSSSHKKVKLSKRGDTAASSLATEKPPRSAHSVSSSPPPSSSPSTPRQSISSNPSSDALGESTRGIIPKGKSGSVAAAVPLTCTTPKTKRDALPLLSSKADVASGSAKSSVPPQRVTELQKTYLAKLKEQELVQNYIDILTNQIKELKFVQSGVITFDALNTHSPAKNRVVSQPPSDQLDNINNVRDLDAFLAHLTTQSNVIHSVTKKFVGDSSKEGSHVQSQIKHYLDLKANHSGTRSQLARESDLPDPTKISLADQISMVPDHDLINSTSPDTCVSIEPHSVSPNNSDAKEADGRLGGSKANSFFTSGFLRPLNMNLFEQEEGILNVDIINERDPFSSSVGSMEKKRPDSVIDGDIEGLNGAPEFKQINVKGAKKIGCGFCSGENPCLCFDTDGVFGEK
ncbi:hypothetical protein JCM33374_g2896 [Metschnikowia sp. JCM 33374]|nr:hypothetical protein JCM33374_g2896 [Metschnikowia sp. JCM 33374]